MLDEIRRQIASLSESDRLSLMNELLITYFRTLDGERIIVDDAGETLGVLCPMVPAHLLPSISSEAQARSLERIRRTPRRPAREVMQRLWGSSTLSTDTVAAHEN